MILKKGRFSDFEELEICEHLNLEEYKQESTTPIET